MKIRSMTRGEMNLAIDWAASEGWNPGLSDADCFYPVDRRGFLIGLLESEPVACISVPAYDATFGFLGFYIVRPEYRGRGFGWEIWQRGLAYLGERTIGLDGVSAQQDNYRKSGFEFAHRSIRYGGVIDASSLAGRQEAVSFNHTHFEKVLTYDRNFFPAPRHRFLECWLNPKKRTVKVLLRDDELAGYAVLRRCRTGFKIGPLFAENEMAANSLFAALAAEVKAEEIFIDVPEPNRSGISLAERFGLKPVFETARMYKGSAPDLPLERTYSITSFELG